MANVQLFANIFWRVHRNTIFGRGQGILMHAPEYMITNFPPLKLGIWTFFKLEKKKGFIRDHY